MKLAIGGCSFSRDFEVRAKQRYPFLLSRLLGTKLVDEARTQGSNYRIWRTLTKHIIENNINAKDKLIIQYTEPHRREYWIPQPPTHFDPIVDEPYDNGKLFRYKYGADQYSHGIEKSLYKLLYRCDNEKYTQEMFEINHAMFVGLLKSKKFQNVVFVKTRYCNFTDKSYVENYPVVDCDDILEAQNLDGWHLSPAGHYAVAERLVEFFQT